jgi:hypothetical protein
MWTRGDSPAALRVKYTVRAVDMGTTHPYFMARLCHAGVRRRNRAADRTRRTPLLIGRHNLKRDTYGNLAPGAAVEAIEAAGLAFDRPDVNHLLGISQSTGRWARYASAAHSTRTTPSTTTRPRPGCGVRTLISFHT